MLCACWDLRVQHECMYITFIFVFNVLVSNGCVNSLPYNIPNQECASHNGFVPAFWSGSRKFGHFCIDGVAPQWCSNLTIALLAYFSGKNNQSEQLSSFCVCLLKPGLTWPCASHHHHCGATPSIQKCLKFRFVIRNAGTKRLCDVTIFWTLKDFSHVPVVARIQF